MGTGYKELFIEYLEAEDKDKCLDFALRRLSEGEFDIRELYEKIMAPALNQIKICPAENVNWIWKEHVKTSIVRTIIECCYPYIMKEKKAIKSLGIKVLVFCPENELHEIGARMITDFFILNGYNAIFVGANTPTEQIKAAVIYEKPRYVAISVSNYYNMISLKRAIEQIKATANNTVSILVGGIAFRGERNLAAQIGADAYLESYMDIRKLGEGDWKNEIGL